MNNTHRKIKNLTVLHVFFAGFTVFFAGCKEEGRLDHINDSAPAPGQVTITNVYGTPGGAVLKYKLPVDKNLLSVKAVYEIKPGVERYAESSYYKDSLILEGFGDTLFYNVQVYSIGKNEKASAPLTVEVKPKKAPVHLATKMMQETFGGIAINIENPEKATLAVALMADTANVGYMSVVQTFYTAAATARFVYRGLDSIPYDFAVYLRDRWSHLSDTTSATLTPWYEQFIPKNTWEEVHLPTDSWLAIENHNPAFHLNRAWDGVIDNPDRMFASSYDSPMPQWVTWTLGRTVIIGRLKIWHRGPQRAFEQQWPNVRKFELYGSMQPNPDGSWDSWIPLGTYECVRPSGAETPTEEDLYYGSTEGIDFDVEPNEFAPDPYVPVRYIRFKSLENYAPAPTGSIFLNEISFWGREVK